MENRDDTAKNTLNNTDSISTNKQDFKEITTFAENFYDSTTNENFTNELHSLQNEKNIKYALPNVSAEDTLAMKKILEKMYKSAEKITENIAEVSEFNDYGRDLIIAKNNTVNIGNKYEIKVRFSETLGSKKNFYDIFETGTNKCLCKDLFLFEAAEAIVKLLNRGENILGEKIRKVVFFEQKYVKNRQDAAVFKKRLTESKNKRRDYKIYEMKYINAKEEALKAKKKIIEIINGL